MRRRSALVMALVSVVAVGSVVALGAAGLTPRPSPSPLAVVSPAASPSSVRSPGPSAGVTPSQAPTPSATPSPSPTPTPTPTASPTPTPIPTPALVPAPLTGRLVTPDVASRHPVAVMIDDQFDARPQSGFNAASVVWQAPAEGGIPRYMLIFQDQVPAAVGPVRSARYYYIAWAAESKAVFAHVGGSPQALRTVESKGQGQLVYDADQYVWGETYFHRIRTRAAPHNVYTDGKLLWKMAARIGAKDVTTEPTWHFAPDAPLAERPTGGTISVAYLANKISYAYDRTSNTYLRSVTGEKKQTDAATGKRVAPKNVVIMRMKFGPLNDGHPAKQRLEADVIGSGKAWIATNGKTIEGTWKKTGLDAPTEFFDGAGNPVTLTIGQTFIQVMEQDSPVSIKDGAVPGSAPSIAPSSSVAAN